MTCEASAGKAEGRFDCFLLVRSDKLCLLIGRNDRKLSLLYDGFSSLKT